MTPSERPTQRERVLLLAADRQYAGFTRLDAVQFVGCFELASRIGELEADGCTFARQTETVATRYGALTHATRYRLTYAPPSLVAHARARVAAERS